MKNILLFTILLTILSGCQIPDSDNINIHRPNILMIVTDDMGWHDLGIYGNDFIETPHLDKLANEGLMFTDAYAAAPLCSPSRAAIMTGLHPITVNITEHIHGNPPPRPDQKLKTPPVSQQLDLKYTTLAELLKPAGYHTGFIGKWHLGGGQFEPQHQGFDLNIAGSYNGLPSSFFYPFFRMGEKPILQNNSKEGDYLTDVLTDVALDYITDNQDSTFFLSLNYYSPHVPIEAKDSLVQKYLKKRGGDASDTIMPNLYYAAMIDCIDENVGRIVNRLDSLQLSENTLIIFTSDNGGLSVKEVPAFAKHTPPTDNGPLRAGKGYLYEGGIREPLIIRWPALIRKSRKISKPVIAQDFFNTLAEITGQDTTTADGMSLLPLFEGNAASEDNQLNERELLWHMPHYSPQGGKPCSALRKGDWKIIYFYEDDRYELYNLAQDLSEEKDLSNESPDKLNEMKSVLETKFRVMNARPPEPNPAYMGK